MPATPPTTPPAIAPIFVEFLEDVDAVAILEVVLELGLVVWSSVGDKVVALGDEGVDSVVAVEISALVTLSSTVVSLTDTSKDMDGEGVSVDVSEIVTSPPASSPHWSRSIF